MTAQESTIRPLFVRERVNTNSNICLSLLDLFRAQVGERVPTIQVSIRLTFVLKEFPLNSEKELKKENYLNLTESQDPLQELQLASIWSSLAEDAVIDSENHSDLDPKLCTKMDFKSTF